MPPTFWGLLFSLSSSMAPPRKKGKRSRSRSRSCKNFRYKKSLPSSSSSHPEKRARLESPLLHNDNQRKPPPLGNIPLHLRFRSSSSSSYYSGLLFPECDSDGKQLIYLPTSTSTSADCSLNVNFSQQPFPCERLIASTNGLLCLKCRGDDNIVYVCNPSTKEGHVVRLTNSWLDDDDEFRVTWRSSIGLAYDPSSSSSSSYKLVCPRSQYEEDKDRMVFGFEVFSSQTNEWEKSLSGECYMEEPHELAECYDLFGPPDKMMRCSTYAGGVLYWNCSFYLLRFDPEKCYGGTLLFPFHPFEYDMDDYEIGECEGHLTLSRVSSVGGMQLWILQQDSSTSSGGGGGGHYWELMHQVGFDTVMDTNPYVFRSFFHLDEMLLRKKNRSEIEVQIMEHGFIATQLPYGGGQRLFITLPLPLERERERERGVRRKQEENVLCYDTNSGKLNKYCTISVRNKRGFHQPIFLYRSSMLSLPKLGTKVP